MGVVSLILKRTSYRFEEVDTWFWKHKRKKEKGADSRESYRYESCMLLPFSFALVFAFDVCSLVLEGIVYVHSQPFGVRIVLHLFFFFWIFDSMRKILTNFENCSQPDEPVGKQDQLIH